MTRTVDWIVFLLVLFFSCSANDDDDKGYSNPDLISSDLTKEEILEVVQNPNKYHTTIFHGECKPHIGSWTKNCNLIDEDITGYEFMISKRKLDNVTLRTFCSISWHNEGGKQNKSDLLFY